MSKRANQIIDLGFLKGESVGTNLSSMFASSVAAELEMHGASMITIDRLGDNPYQPRVGTYDTSIDDLAGVIKSQGFQGVLVARPKPGARDAYQITAGHRRREAARRAGLTTLPVIVRELTDEEMVTLAITENIQREDLTPLEEGRIYMLMIGEMGYTHEQVAKEVGKKRGYIENRLRVAKAPPDVQSLVQARPDTLRAVSYLVKVKDGAERAEIIEQIKKAAIVADDVPGLMQAQKERGQALGSNPKADTVLEKHTDRVMGMDSVAVAKHPGGRSSGETGADVDAQTARLGGAKLSTILRYLTNYKEQSAGRESISMQEQAILAKIEAIVEELHGSYC